MKTPLPETAALKGRISELGLTSSNTERPSPNKSDATIAVHTSELSAEKQVMDEINPLKNELNHAIECIPGHFVKALDTHE